MSAQSELKCTKVSKVPKVEMDYSGYLKIRLSFFGIDSQLDVGSPGNWLTG